MNENQTLWTPRRAREAARDFTARAPLFRGDPGKAVAVFDALADYAGDLSPDDCDEFLSVVMDEVTSAMQAREPFPDVGSGPIGPAS